jgi:hypothetical protein
MKSKINFKDKIYNVAFNLSIGIINSYENVWKIF